MADIFISYSHQDGPAAQLLATFLQGEGYTVWWDNSLLAGERFRKTIMSELGRARAVIVIWTHDSITSDWIQSEAGRALADHKLIPVKTQRLSYRDIPPPFDNMHIENIERHQHILGAVVATLARPAQQPSSVAIAYPKAKYELMSSLVLTGTALSLAAKLTGLITIGAWARHILAVWEQALKAFWSYVLFFLPTIESKDAVYFSLISFVLMNIFSASDKTGSVPSGGANYVRLAVPGFILAGVFATAYYYAFMSDLFGAIFRCMSFYREPNRCPPPPPPGFTDFVFSTVFGPIWSRFPEPGPWIHTSLLLISVGSFLAVTFTLIYLLYSIIRKMTGRRVNRARLASRLWRIIFILCFIVAAGFISAKYEQL